MTPQNGGEHGYAFPGESKGRLPGAAPGGGRNVCFHPPELTWSELKHKIAWEPLNTSFDSLHQHARWNLIEERKIGTEHDLCPTHSMDAAIDHLMERGGMN